VSTTGVGVEIGASVSCWGGGPVFTRRVTDVKKKIARAIRILVLDMTSLTIYQWVLICQGGGILNLIGR